MTFEPLDSLIYIVEVCIKESLLIRSLKPALNENVGSEKLLLYLPFIFFQQTKLGLLF